MEKLVELGKEKGLTEILRNNGEIGRIFILVTANTQEVVWYKRMTETMNEDNLNIIQCQNIEDCISKIEYYEVS